MDHSTEDKQGVLYVVATPIGNLEDITLRAIRILKEVQLIAAEDTRHTRVLLEAHGIATPLISLHEHNEKERSALLLNKLTSGMDIAYVSDAGTPCISDPGYYLVDLALENHIRVVPVPGPSAVIASLSVCGFPADRFVFYGFLPSKESQRRGFLESVQSESNILVFYESPARIAAALQDVLDILGDRQIVLARELTKLFEDIRRGNVSDILSQISASRAKGEFVLIVRGAPEDSISFSDDDIRNALNRIWKTEEISLRDAVYRVIRETGLSKRRVYNIAVKMNAGLDTP